MYISHVICISLLRYNYTYCRHSDGKFNKFNVIIGIIIFKPYRKTSVDGIGSATGAADVDWLVD